MTGAVPETVADLDPERTVYHTPNYEPTAVHRVADCYCLERGRGVTDDRAADIDGRRPACHSDDCWPTDTVVTQTRACPYCPAEDIELPTHLPECPEKPADPNV